MDSDVKMPVLFLSHGAPPLVDDPVWPGELAQWASELPRPNAILMISAHWEADPIMLGATRTVPLVYDFSGFDNRYYALEYRAPGAPDLAADIRQILSDVGIVETERGLDHGAYLPLVEMYPEADIPVLQISMPTLNPQVLFQLGTKLAPLRDKGVLIVGSGFSTHNLAMIDWSGNQPIPTITREFDNWLASSLETRDIDSLIDFESKAPAARLAHPRTEHFAPLFISLGAMGGDYRQLDTPVGGFWMGMSKRSVQFS